MRGAIDDIVEGFRLSPLWWRLALEQTIARYGRTVLGPFWLASSVVATGLALSIVFGTIFGGDWRQNFAFIFAGVVCFGLIAALLVEGSQTFIAAAGMLQVRKLPLSFHAMLLCTKILINFAHQVVAFWFVTLICQLFPVPHWELMFTLPLVMATGFLAIFPLGFLSTRYRDVAHFIGFLMTALFMLTPVFWRASQIPQRLHWIVGFNPLSHMLEVLRQPFLGHPAPIEDLLSVLLTFTIVLIGAIISLAFYRRRVVFWL